MAKVYRFPGAPDEGHPAPAPAALAISRDDYSVKITVAGDRRFWVRAEPVSLTVCRITDFNAGEQDEADLIRAIVMAVDEICPAGPQQIDFINLVSGPEEPQRLGFLLERMAERLRRAAEAVGQAHGKAITGFEIHEARAKFNLTVTLAPA